MQESSGERLDRRREQPASDPSSELEKQPREMTGGQGSHLPHEREEGKGQEEGPQAPQAVQEVRMGARGFRPPPNLMRVGTSP
jgi:hypothetical protein